MLPDVLASGSLLFKKSCCGWALLLTEGFAVGALIHCGVSLVGAHQDTVERTVVRLIAVIGALGNGTFDALIGFAVHFGLLLFS